MDKIFVIRKLSEGVLYEYVLDDHGIVMEFARGGDAIAYLISHGYAECQIDREVFVITKAQAIADAVRQEEPVMSEESLDDELFDLVAELAGYIVQFKSDGEVLTSETTDNPIIFECLGDAEDYVREWAIRLEDIRIVAVRGQMEINEILEDDEEF